MGVCVGLENQGKGEGEKEKEESAGWELVHAKAQDKLQNGTKLQRNSSVGSLFPYFNYLVIPTIYIMYLAHPMRHRLRRRGFPIGSTPSRIPNRTEGSEGGGGSMRKGGTPRLLIPLGCGSL